MVAGKTSSMGNEEGLDMAALHSLTQLPRPIALTLLGAAGILLANAYISYENTRRLQDANAWIVHSANVLGEERAGERTTRPRAGQARARVPADRTGELPRALRNRQPAGRRAAGGAAVPHRRRRDPAGTRESTRGAGPGETRTSSRARSPRTASAAYRRPRETVIRNEERHLTDEVQAVLAELRAEEEKIRATCARASWAGARGSRRSRAWWRLPSA